MQVWKLWSRNSNVNPNDMLLIINLLSYGFHQVQNCDNLSFTNYRYDLILNNHCNKLTILHLHSLNWIRSKLTKQLTFMLTIPTSLLGVGPSMTLKFGHGHQNW